MYLNRNFMIYDLLYKILILLDILSLTSTIMIIFQIHYWKFVMLHGFLLLVKDYYFFGDFITNIELFFAIYLLLAPLGFINEVLNVLCLFFFAYKIAISIL